MICNKCGEKVPDTAKYCDYCGGKITESGNKSYKSESRYFDTKISIKSKIIGVLIIAIGVFSMQYLIDYGKDYLNERKIINIVKDGAPIIFDTDISFGKAFNKYFQNPEWRGYENADGYDIVEFDGDIVGKEYSGHVFIQFVITNYEEDNEEFQARNMIFRGEIESDITISDLIEDVYNEY